MIRPLERAINVLVTAALVIAFFTLTHFYAANEKEAAAAIVFSVPSISSEDNQ